MIGTVVKTLLRGLMGVITGLVYYFLYVAVLPIAFQRMAGLPVSVELPIDFSTIFVVFIALGVTENVAPPVPSAVFRVLSKLVGASYLYFAMDGGVVSANVGSYIVTLDLSLLIYIILAGSAMVGVLDAATYACKGTLKE